ncbi:calcium-binding protein, partial [Pseudomonas sp. BLCC-B13]|uniref:calcium-binding protein n=1 Tax=Pseudomonas sp. BLCC-B13 TaxID=3025314 RepID=UPI00234EF935
EGTDTVHSSISWTLGTELENLLLIGTNAINGTGNALDNQITGNSANNVLNGGAGADTLIGSLGNDTYVVDNVADVVTELAGQGTDTVSSNIAWSLGAELENLILTGAASINGTGNALRNSLTGNNGNNILDGGAGTDTLAGGLGNDTYIVDLIQVGSGSTATAALEDSLSEQPGAGNDTIQLRGTIAGLTHATTLSFGPNMENLDASATGTTRLNLTGNASSNILTGNAADNRIDGGAGIDTLIGGLGNDILIGNLGVDNLTGGEGADTFLFNALNELGLGALRDVITDFNANQGDRINLAALDANDLLSGNNAFTFIGSASFTGLGQLRFQDQTLYGNLSGDTSADFEIQLLGISSLDANSLVV